MFYRVFLFLFLLPALALADTGRADECKTFYETIGEKIAVTELAEGPRIWLPALPNSRQYEDFHQLNFTSYNVLNLSESIGRHERDPITGAFRQTTPKETKPDWARKAVAEKLLEKKPDLAFLEEVEGLGSLNEFNKNFLNSEYRPLLIKGNDERGIDVGILVKKDIPLDIEILSQANRTYKNPLNGVVHEVLSRDAPVVLLRRKGAPQGEKPLMAFIGTHLKSQRDANMDPKSVLRRTAQAEEYVRIKEDLQKKFPGLPIVISGDFNADLHSSKEFHPLWKMGMKDSFDLGPTPLRQEDRVTHSFHPGKNHPEFRENPKIPGQSIPVYSQIDGVLVSAEGSDLVKESGVLRYQDANGKTKPLPQTYEQRETNPSDHFPVFTIFDWDKLKAKTSSQ